MDKLIIKGSADLSGEISIKGSKNSALPIMVGALLSEDVLKLKNIPKLADIENMSKLLRNYGATIKSNRDNVEINSKKNCYIYVLDQDGIIKGKFEGFSTPEKMNELFTLIDSLNE